MDYDPSHHLEADCRIGGCVGCETEEYQAEEGTAVPAKES